MPHPPYLRPQSARLRSLPVSAVGSLLLVGCLRASATPAEATESPRPASSRPPLNVPAEPQTRQASRGDARTSASSAPRSATPSIVPGPLPLTPGTPLPDAHRRWIDSTLSSLSLRERVAQMVMVWVLGDYTNAADPGFLTLVRHVERDGIGGVVMSLGSPIEVAAKLNALQQRARVPLLVASDVEPGLGRLEGGAFVTASYSAGSATVLPSNMAMGAAASDSLAAEMGRITGLESRAIGIHMAFAPVVDVNNNPSNPVINTRSFGEDPQRVAALSAAFIRGLQSVGVAATAKHFPGHGDTDTDSHLGLPVIAVARARLDSIELVPFTAAIAAGAAGMMTAHIALPTAYGDSTPATLSPRVMRGLLRDTLAFAGLTVTDAMTMDGITKGFGVEESTILSVEAGDDVILMPPDVGRAIDAIVQAVGSGRLRAERIDESVRRILEMKLRTGAVSRPIVSLDSLRDVVGAPAHRRAADAVAARAVTLLRDRRARVPLKPSASIHVFTIVPDSDPLSGTWFAAEVRRLGSRVKVSKVSPRALRRELDSLARVARRSDRIIVYSYTRTLEGAGRLAIPAPIAGFITRLGPSGKMVVVAGGNPYQIRQMPKIPSYLVTYGRGEALERAAARAVLGAAPITGRVPVSLPELFRLGDGLDRLGSPVTGTPE